MDGEGGRGIERYNYGGRGAEQVVLLGVKTSHHPLTLYLIRRPPRSAWTGSVTSS